MASTYIGALGIGVSDLERSTDFYTRVIGKKKLQTLNIPHMNEEVLGFEGRGASLVLMHYIETMSMNLTHKEMVSLFEKETGIASP